MDLGDFVFYVLFAAIVVVPVGVVVLIILPADCRRW
jgi:hypothetical protein